MAIPVCFPGKQVLYMFSKAFILENRLPAVIIKVSIKAHSFERKKNPSLSSPSTHKCIHYINIYILFSLFSSGTTHSPLANLLFHRKYITPYHDYVPTVFLSVASCVTFTQGNGVIDVSFFPNPHYNSVSGLFERSYTCIHTSRLARKIGVHSSEKKTARKSCRHRQGLILSG